MWDNLWPVVGAIAVGLLTTYAGWYVARRQRSGGVHTSEAADLWKESSQIRQELYTQVTALRSELSGAYEKSHALTETLAAMKIAHEDCTDQLEGLAIQVAALKTALEVERKKDDGSA